MTIIGIVGRNGAGKRTLANYLNEWCATPVVSMRDMAREMATELGMAPAQLNLVEVSRRAIERDGVDTFANRAIQTLEDKGWDIAVILGIRLPAEVQVLRDYYRDDFVLIHIAVTDAQVRYERIRERDGALTPRTFEEFLQQEKVEQDLFDLDAAIEQADLTILNDGRLEDLHLEIQQTLIQGELADDISCGEDRVRPRRE